MLLNELGELCRVQAENSDAEKDKYETVFIEKALRKFCTLHLIPA